jgi:hypothetical protein
MKRAGGLYETICSFENLHAAACQARRGKRLRPDVAAFHYDLERNLFDLRAQLLDKTYQPGPYRAFYIQDPKRRLISAAPYRDRVVHHALCRAMEPIFERGFIHDCYANRVGKGTHKALDRATYFARRNAYVLKCDIEKYFPSIDHRILEERIARKIKCRGTLWLAGAILANSNPQEEAVRYYPGDDLFTPGERRRGIPIGNLTSQFFANLYLDGFDHYVQEALGPAGYVRFSDDFLLFSDDRARLSSMTPVLQQYLDGLRLTLHGRKCQVFRVRDGFPFLGWQVYPEHRRLRRTTGVRIGRRLRELRNGHAAGEIGWDRVRASVMSWIGHLKHGDTWALRGRLLASAAFLPQRSRIA